MRAAIYARYSSDLQREASIEDQVRLARARIDREGWKPSGTYTDRAVSGSVRLRSGYQKLLEDARNGEFEVVVAEALDRLSRDQEDVAALYKHLSFAGVKLVTLSEGEISELHVGLKGTMNALFLKDLAQKVRRGLEGRVRQGRSGGGLCYGYDVVRETDARGEPVHGGRSIDEREAEVVRRIFREFAQGRPPRAVAHALNRENIAGPRGSAWGQSTINGNRERGTGIINNELYIGRLVWNRLQYVKDPVTRKRVSRLNPRTLWQTVEVPELRIVPQEVWDAAKERQQRLDQKLEHRRTRGSNRRSGISATRRPAHLLSGLIHCGVCSGGMALVGGTSYGCSTARNKGTCSNRRTIRRHDLERLVLQGLKEQLMQPDAVKAFVAEFHREINRLIAERRAQVDCGRRELEKVEREIRAIVDAIKAGAFSPVLQRELAAPEARQVDLEGRLAASAPAPLALHPKAAEIYRRKVAALHEALGAETARAEAAEALRALIDQIRVTPEGQDNTVEIVGELAELLRLSGAKNAASITEAARSAKLVAGKRNQRYLQVVNSRIPALSLPFTEVTGVRIPLGTP